MAEVNAFTGMKRRKSVRNTTRKKRATLSYTPASFMYSVQALEAFEIYMAGANMNLSFLSLLAVSHLDLSEDEKTAVFSFPLLGGHLCYTLAIEMLRLDSELMDLSDETIENAGYRKELVGITLDWFVNDDDCREQTRFTKGEIQLIVDSLPLGQFLYVHYNPPKYYKFDVTELLIYTLHCMSTGRTHKDLCDNEFGGCPKGTRLQPLNSCD